ncbi:MAG TPA: hypothetical protein VEQ59_12160 [Polyangiaceae bacterium]|nr:hypothetical protein [Polyangiaceae bacterium]
MGLPLPQLELQKLLWRPQVFLSGSHVGSIRAHAPRMKTSLARKSWPASLGVLGFLPPFFGMLPRYCESPDPGGHGGAAGQPSSAGEGGAAGSSAGESTGGASEEAGAGGAGAELPDLVSEPLLGCVSGVSGKQTPGVFQVLEPYFDLPSPDYRWLTDWSGDGQTAVGFFTNEPFEDAYGAFFIRWRNGQGYDLEEKISIDTTKYNEPQEAKVNCDGTAEARILGDGSWWTTKAVSGAYDPNAGGYDYYHLVFSEDGTSLTFTTGIPNFKQWTEWHSTKGPEATALLDPADSISADGLTVFGTSYCYYQTCEQPKTYRWQLPDGGEDVSTTAPTSVVAADGQSVVYAFDPTRIGIWRDGTIEQIDCPGPCQAVAWSSRAQVLLVNLDGDFALWTRPHGFRRLTTLLNVPENVAIVPTGLSLDGWTVTGTAGSSYFRATLRADAFK